MKYSTTTKSPKSRTAKKAVVKDKVIEQIENGISNFRDKNEIMKATSKYVNVEDMEALFQASISSSRENIIQQTIPEFHMAQSVDYRRFTGLFTFEDFDTLKIAFKGNQTLYDWGNHLTLVNSSIVQQYLRIPQTSDTIMVEGIDPSVSIGNVNWGNVVFIVQHLQYSDRFGGSFHVRLIPNEKYGIELVDASKNMYINLNRWALNLWIQPKKTFFNNPLTVLNSIKNNVYAEIEIQDSEVYNYLGGAFVPATAFTDEEIKNLVNKAEIEAKDRLKELSLFSIGFVHNKHIPDFTSAGEIIEEIYISDNLCSFRKKIKTTFIEILLNISYYGMGSLEGPFDDNAEVTSHPWLLLKESQLGYVVMSNQRSKYIGSASSTGYLTMGYLSLDEIERVRHALIYPSWTEDDPLFDDSGGGYGISFADLNFDKNDLETKANSNQLGQVGPDLIDTMDDPVESNVSYLVRLKFNLVKR